jgi:hypothetical protein
MSDNGKTDVRPNDAEPPGKAIPEKQIVRMLQCSLCQKLAAVGNVLPFKFASQAFITNLAGWILNATTVLARLKSKSATRCHGC